MLSEKIKHIGMYALYLHAGNANLSLAHIIFLESSGIHYEDIYSILTNKEEHVWIKFAG